MGKMDLYSDLAQVPARNRDHLSHPKERGVGDKGICGQGLEPEYKWESHREGDSVWPLSWSFSVPLWISVPLSSLPTISATLFLQLPSNFGLQEALTFHPQLHRFPTSYYPSCHQVQLLFPSEDSRQGSNWPSSSSGKALGHKPVYNCLSLGQLPTPAPIIESSKEGSRDPGHLHFFFLVFTYLFGCVGSWQVGLRCMAP